MYDGELLVNYKDERDENNIPKFIGKTDIKFDDNILNIVYAPMPSKEYKYVVIWYDSIRKLW